MADNSSRKAGTADDDDDDVGGGGDQAVKRAKVTKHSGQQRRSGHGLGSNGANAGTGTRARVGNTPVVVPVEEEACDGGTVCWRDRCRHGRRTHPVVFRGAAQSWRSAAWTPHTMASNAEFGHCHVKALFHKRGERPASEAECMTAATTLRTFARWILKEQHEQQASSVKDDTGGAALPAIMREHGPKDLVGYVSYQYVAHVFSTTPALRDAFPWTESLGVPSQDAQLENAAFWFGTEGAVTPCHYDTYGCNLVVQLHGTKRWTLFAPQDSDRLYPSRLPFEESTVRSSVNVDAPDTAAHPRFAEIGQMWRVDLQPGDVLFVPHHWWHHVRCTTTAISTNLWMPHPSDSHSLVTEAISQYLVARLCEQDTSFFCPTQDPVPSHEALLQLKDALVAQERRETDKQTSDAVRARPAREFSSLTPSQLRRVVAEALLNPANVSAVAADILHHSK